MIIIKVLNTFFEVLTLEAGKTQPEKTSFTTLKNHTECTKIYHKPVLDLLKFRFAVYLSRCSTELKYILGLSVFKYNIHKNEQFLNISKLDIIIIKANI